MTGGQDHSGDAVRQLLAEIQQGADAATKGPWEVDRNLPFSPEIVGVFAPDVKRYVFQQDVDGDAWGEDAEEPDGLFAVDALFISRSRSDVPRLVAALTAVLDLTAKYRYGALRWADPLPVPEWVDRVEQAVAAALGDRS